MANKAIITGAALGLLGVVVSLLSESDSITSYIPAFIGLVFVAIGVGAKLLPNANHHFMHAAAVVSLLAILGSVGSIIGRGSTGWALFSQVATIGIAGAFLFLAIQSFKAARLAREAEV